MASLGGYERVSLHDDNPSEQRPSASSQSPAESRSRSRSPSRSLSRSPSPLATEERDALSPHTNFETPSFETRSFERAVSPLDVPGESENDIPLQDFSRSRYLSVPDIEYGDAEHDDAERDGMAARISFAHDEAFLYPPLDPSAWTEEIKEKHLPVPVPTMGKKTSKMKYFPWQGISSLVAVIILTGGAAAVLAASNESALSKWEVGKLPVQPQVWVSLLSTIMDALLVFALAEGVSCSFWRKAETGVTLFELYEYFESSAVIGAIARLFRGRLNIVAISCLLAALSALRGPLLQRASFVDEHATFPTKGELEIRMAQVLPLPYYYPSGPAVTYGRHFEGVLKDFLQQDPTPLTYGECGDECDTRVKGFGFKVQDCRNASFPFDLSIGGGEAENAENITSLTFAIGSNAWSDSQNQFDLNANSLAWRDRFDVTTVFKDTTDCRGDVKVNICTLRQGLVEYDVHLANGRASLVNPHHQNDTFISETIPFSEADAFDTMTWWAEAFNRLFSMQANITWRAPTDDPSSSDQRDDKGSWVVESEMAGSASMLFSSNSGSYDSGNCSISWTNPMQDILDSMRELAFRCSISAGAVEDPQYFFPNGTLYTAIPEDDWHPIVSNWTQHVSYEGKVSFAAYRTNFDFLAAAISVSLMGVFAVAPLYWAWWELGHRASLNPLDVAHAFNAPIFQGVEGSRARNRRVQQVTGAQGSARWSAIDVSVPSQARHRRGDATGDNESTRPRLTGRFARKRPSNATRESFVSATSSARQLLR
ncbi:hypothetical protein BDY21DRAFT_107255 [Lineolata rhizophorae]|uniref:Uncharacterized protein n=1 Tax=Lineolata rhizophorae TaxID=578093 RepID=A0A6A6NRT5_9PEZI|nr:hypothetical protein BDY21DRAFT_107255 [Lineolata rhizophorae]